MKTQFNTVATVLSVASVISAFSTNSLAAHTNNALETITVTEQRSKRTIKLEDTLTVLPDTAALIKKAPGGNVNGNGPITGIPQYRGMQGSRIGVNFNGMQLAPAGPNWMDPPLSYVSPAQLESLEVYRGIAPVSVAQESIGGAISVNAWQGGFGNTDKVESEGRASAMAQSVNNATQFSGALALANKSHRLSVSGMTEQADDAEFNSGVITPTEYTRQRGEINYGWQSGNHELQLGFARNETDNAGTPALPMDIGYIDGDLYHLFYRYSAGTWEVESKLYGSELAHGMSNYHLRSAPTNKMLWRQNIATTDNNGFDLNFFNKDETGSWQLGFDYFKSNHESNISNPNNANFFVSNFNHVEREVTGVFAEREQQLGSFIKAELGLRVNSVNMNAGTVDATPARMMPPAAALRDSFNQANRKQSDTNVDAVAKFWFESSKQISYYIAMGHKTRSPSYQERYLWLPLQATAGLADGLTYTGNINLKAEKATELELGFDVSRERLTVSPRIFYRKVSDYIQGTQSTIIAANMFVNMLNRANGSRNPAPLQFNNVDATLWGVDMDWRYQLTEHWSAKGLLNYVRGERDDINDNLYRLAPTNLSASIEYNGHDWGANIEAIIYAKQDKVSQTNNEIATDSYELLNISAWRKFSDNINLAVGVNNLLDEEYLNHLGGYNRALNADIAKGNRLPGFGRSVFATLNYQW